MSAKTSTLMPSSSGTASSSRRAPYRIKNSSTQPGVLEPELQRRQGRRALDVGLHPVALELVAEHDQRARLLEPAHELGVHLLARGRARGEAEGVEALVGLLGLEAAEVP